MECEFKIGDKVRCLEDNDGHINPDTILTIKNIYNSKLVKDRFILSFEETKYKLYHYEVELESQGYWNILEECTEIAIQRQQQYAPIRENYQHMCEAYKAITGKDTTPEEFNNFMIALKIGRIRSNPEHKDNVIDAINYLAIGLHLKGEKIKNENIYK
jgi:hypothetical protein